MTRSYRTQSSAVATLADREASARILIVDDEPANVNLLERLLTRTGYHNVMGTTDVRVALAELGSAPVDLLLLDLHMPHVNGVEVLQQLRSDRAGPVHSPVIVLTADASRAAMERVLAAGASDLITKPFDAVEVLLRIRNHLQVRLLHVHMEELVRERTAQLEDAHHEMIARLAQAAEFRDDATGQHVRRVAALSRNLARALGLGPSLCDLIAAAAPLHDIGKIAIPDAILLKPGPLTPAEWAVMRTHPTIGGRLLSGGTSELLAVAQRIALRHHERWDGKGYPDGLAGEAIPIEARVVAVADFFDAMTHARPYRAPLTAADVLEELQRNAGAHFDPDVAAAMVTIHD